MYSLLALSVRPADREGMLMDAVILLLFNISCEKLFWRGLNICIMAFTSVLLMFALARIVSGLRLTNWGAEQREC